MREISEKLCKNAAATRRVLLDPEVNLNAPEIRAALVRLLNEMEAFALATLER